MSNRPTLVAVFYCVASAIWLIGSDVLLFRASYSPRIAEIISIGKGLTFVCVSAALMTYLLRRAKLSVQAAKEAQDAHTESERRFRVLADTAPVLVWMSGTDAKCDFFNKGWVDFTGRSMEQEIGDGWAEGVHAEDFQLCVDTYLASFHARQPFSMEYRLRRHDGEYRWILDTGVPRYSETGAFAGYIGSCVDVTELREAHERLSAANQLLRDEVVASAERVRRGEQRYRRIVETALEGIWEIDETNRTTFVNPSMARMLGHKPEEMLGSLVFQYSDPEWQVITRAKLDRRRTGISEQHEFKFRHSSGSEVWAIINTTPIMEEGQYRGATAVITDITERKAAEERLQQYATELRLMLEHAPYGISRSTHDGRFLLVNPAFVHMLGYDSVSELLATPARQLYADTNSRERFFREISRTGSIRNCEAELVKKDRSLIKVRASGVMSANNELHVFVEDITQAAELEDRVRQSAKLESVGRLAGGVAHDFNNLLMVISSNLQMALDDKYAHVSVRKHIGDAMHASKRAANLTAQLLAFSRRQVLRPARINLNDTVESVARMLERVIGENIQVRLDCSPSLGTIEVDPSQIEQVIMNLAVNARDAMPNGGSLCIQTTNVTLDESYRQAHQVVNPGTYVMLAVSDTGMGMDSDTMRHVFEPFFTTKDQSKGTGLGLATVYGIVKQSRGFVWVYSEVGQGTTFKVYLPRVDAQVTYTEDESSAKVFHAGSGAILVIEDEPMIREIITGQLTEAGYKALDAGTAGEAVRVAGENKAEIIAVLTDVVLPDANGKALADDLRTIIPGVPVVQMSGYTPDVVLHHGVLDPGTHFLQKPFSRTQLLELLEKVLGTRVSAPCSTFKN